MTSATIKIPAELLTLAETADFEGTLELDAFRAGPDVYTFDAPLTWKATATNTGSALLVTGSVAGEGVSSCSRCLDEAVHSFAGAIEGYYLMEDAPSAPPADEDDGPEDDEFEVLPADHVIDLEPLIVAALLMDAPRVLLCQEECAGLCPSCGANLNDGPCGCSGDAALEDFDRAANPFSALKDFSFSEPGEQSES